MDCTSRKIMEQVQKSWTAHDFSSACHDFMIIEKPLDFFVFLKSMKNGPSNGQESYKKTWLCFQEGIVISRGVSTRTKFGDEKWKTMRAEKKKHNLSPELSTIAQSPPTSSRTPSASCSFERCISRVCPEGRRQHHSSRSVVVH